MRLKKGKQFIRKRDRVLVSIDSISRKKKTVTYCTYPMLVLWTTSINGFRKNFREVEEAPHVR